MDIKRYTPTVHDVYECPDGELVMYDDHIADKAADAAEIARLATEVERLHKLLYATLPWTGRRTVVDTEDDVVCRLRVEIAAGLNKDKP
jgi:hypothetical protein